MQQATIKPVELVLRPATNEDAPTDDRARAMAVQAGVNEGDVDTAALKMLAWVLEKAEAGELFLYSEMAGGPLPLRVEFGGE